MRILVIAPEWPPHVIGGGGEVFRRVSAGLAARGHRVVVAHGAFATGRGGAYLEEPGVERVEIPLVPAPRGLAWATSATPPTPLGLARLDRLARGGFDAAHVHGFGLAMPDAGAWLCRLRRLPYLFTVHGMPVSPLRRGPALAAVFRAYVRTCAGATARGAAAVSAVSNAMTRDPVFPLPGAHVVRNGVDDPGAPVAPLPHAPGGELRLLTVGRLSENKGIDLAIGAVAELRASGVDARLDCWGLEGGDGPVLAALARAKGAGAHVAFRGTFAAADRGAIFAGAHLLLNPSRFEGFGLAALEALALGMPLVSTTADGLADFVDAEVAWTCGPAVASLRDAILAAVADPAGRARRVAAGRERFRAFLWDAVIDDYETLLAGCARARAVARAPEGLPSSS